MRIYAAYFERIVLIMGIFNLIGGIVMVLASVGIMLAVVLQESPKGGGLNALTGGDSYYSKNQSRTKDAMLSRLTKILAVVFFVVTIGVSIAGRFLG